jgi:hypothetical protein
MRTASIPATKADCMSPKKKAKTAAKDEPKHTADGMRCLENTE